MENACIDYSIHKSLKGILYGAGSDPVFQDPLAFWDSAGVEIKSLN